MLKKNWNLRTNAINPSTSSATSSPVLTSPSPSPSPLKHLIPSISLLDFPAIANNPFVTGTPDTGDDDANHSVKSCSPPFFDCDDMDVFDEAQNRAIRPVQILTNRLEAWYLLTKQLHDFFNSLAAAETQVAKAYRHLSGPTTGTSRRRGSIGDEDKCTAIGWHFEYQDGIRQICHSWLMHTIDTANGHDTMSHYLQTHGIPALTNMKRELKGMIRSVKTDDRLRLSALAKLRRDAKRRFLRLAHQLAFFEQHPDQGHTKEDPWLVNAGVIRQMLKVYHQTNKMHETVLRLQKEVMISEQQLVQAFKQLCHDIYKIREQTPLGIDATYEKMKQAVEATQADADWHAFMASFKDDLIPEHARFLHPDKLRYPNHSHPLLQPLFASRMERSSSFLRRWQEYIYVLTPAGFLHEYRSSKSYPIKPDTTIFIPHYNVSTLSTNLHHNLIFQLQPQALPKHIYAFSSSVSDISSSTSTLSSYMSSREPRIKLTRNKTITFRAKSASDMQLWLEHLTQLSHRYRPAVSYTAPPFLQPTNATNPEIFIASPAMTAKARNPSARPGPDLGANKETPAHEGQEQQEEEQQPPETLSSSSSSSSSAKEQKKEKKKTSSTAGHVARVRSRASNSKTKSFQLTGVCLPDSMT
ncbi:hypothetical protein BX666DRAFT_1876760 [Dichotomocladium elegans]|nr:hypothetical protein BX666DRAFT_1876760 [Dichotomocladium elegans]